MPMTVNSGQKVRIEVLAADLVSQPFSPCTGLSKILGETVLRQGSPKLRRASVRNLGHQESGPVE